ncbi:MAG: hypothetical protein ABI640_17655 [Gammaproteobacteria bacterium]
MIANVIVVLSVLLGVVFVAAWLALPGLRAWLERPKHRFQQGVQRYDRARSREAELRRGRSS